MALCGTFKLHRKESFKLLQGRNPAHGHTFLHFQQFKIVCKVPAVKRSREKSTAKGNVKKEGKILF